MSSHNGILNIYFRHNGIWVFLRNHFVHPRQIFFFGGGMGAMGYGEVGMVLHHRTGYRLKAMVRSVNKVHAGLNQGQNWVSQ